MQEVIDADSRVLAHAISMHRADETPTGETIRIGSFTSVAVNWLPDIIYKYSQENPDVRIELIDGGYNNIEKTFKEPIMKLIQFLYLYYAIFFHYNIYSKIHSYVR